MSVVADTLAIAYREYSIKLFVYNPQCTIGAVLLLVLVRPNSS